MVPITLHTPLPFTGCFPDRCRPSQPCCTKKGAFTPLTRPSTLPFFACKPSFAPEYSQTLPSTARIRSESGESFAQRPAIQAHNCVPEVPGVRLLCAAVPVLPPRLAGVFAGWAVCRQTSFRRASISHGCPCPSSLSAMMEHTFIPLMPDCHGRLFCFALEKSVAPRGDQIPVVGF